MKKVEKRKEGTTQAILIRSDPGVRPLQELQYRGLSRLSTSLNRKTVPVYEASNQRPQFVLEQPAASIVDGCAQ